MLSGIVRCFATTALGLEGVLEQELRRLGAGRCRRGRGGVGFEGDRDLLMRCCVELRTAHRVLWVLGEVDARDKDALYRSVRTAARWQGLITPEHTLAVSARGIGEGFRDTRLAALTVKDAVVDVLREICGSRPNVDTSDPDVRLVIRLHGTRATLSLDAAGQSLHARGYRQEATEAPLRETLAAGVLMLSDWRPGRPLVDPMCGSGTLAIEAAMIARRMAPGLVGRTYGFERWPGHRPERLGAIIEEARARVAGARKTREIFGSDRDRLGIGHARENARRAGLGGKPTFRVASLDELEAPGGLREPGVVICNPPYGQRLGQVRELEGLYRRFGQVLRERFAGWEAWLLLGHREHGAALGLPFGQRFPLKNGPLDVRLQQVRIPR